MNHARSDLKAAETEIRRLESLARTSTERTADEADRIRSLTLNDLGEIARRRGDQEAAVEYNEKGLAINRGIGDRLGEATSLRNLGNVANMRGDLETAANYYEESLAIVREISGRSAEAGILINLGDVAQTRGDLNTAAEYLKKSLAIKREIGDRSGEARCLNNIGSVAYICDDHETARSRFATAADQLIGIGAVDDAETALTNLIDVCETMGDMGAAREWCEQALEVAEQADREGMHEKFRQRLASLDDNDTDDDKASEK